MTCNKRARGWWMIKCNETAGVKMSWLNFISSGFSTATTCACSKVLTTTFSMSLNGDKFPRSQPLFTRSTYTVHNFENSELFRKELPTSFVSIDEGYNLNVFRLGSHPCFHVHCFKIGLALVAKKATSGLFTSKIIMYERSFCPKSPLLNLWWTYSTPSPPPSPYWAKMLL